MAISRASSILFVASLMLLIAGSAHAGGHDSWCKDGYKDCDPYKQGCETFIKSDINNCGYCNNKCPTYPNTAPSCDWGKCGSKCVPGWKDCDGKKDNGCEANLKNDVRNCGSCGTKCFECANAVSKCSNGQCEYKCKSGWANCDGSWGNGCEKDVSKDVKNCGGCGVKCPWPKYSGGEATCSNGKCGVQCKKGMKWDDKKKCCA